MQHLEVSGAVRPIQWSLGVKWCVNHMGTVHTRTGHKGREGEQIYSSALPSTSAPDGGGWSTPRPGRFTPGKDPLPIV